MERREIYGTSGPRILLWFDLLNAPGDQTAPMGSVVALDGAPRFRVRAIGSFEPRAGCSAEARAALGRNGVERLCQGECYRPSDVRRTIRRIEVVRIRPQLGASEEIAPLIEDPWKVLPCDGDPEGCDLTFTDDEFRSSGRNALYYVRAIEAPSMAVGADPLGCTRNESGACIDVSPCFGKPWDDDCLSETEERAWSSPIFVDQAPASLAASTTAASDPPGRNEVFRAGDGGDDA